MITKSYITTVCDVLKFKSVALTLLWYYDGSFYYPKYL